MTRVTGPGVLEMKALGAKLKDADPHLKRELRKNLRDIGRPLADQARESILNGTGWRATSAHPTLRHFQPGAPHTPGTLRGEIAATITVSTRISRTGVQVAIVSYGRRMPAGKTNLPGYSDRGRGWGHPVFGAHTSKTWVRAWGPVDWWEDAFTGAGLEARHACESAIDSTAHMLS